MAVVDARYVVEVRVLEEGESIAGGRESVLVQPRDLGMKAR